MLLHGCCIIYGVVVSFTDNPNVPGKCGPFGRNNELSKQSSPKGQHVLYLYEVLSLKFDSSAKGIGIEKRKGNF